MYKELVSEMTKFKVRMDSPKICMLLCGIFKYINILKFSYDQLLYWQCLNHDTTSTMVVTELIINAFKDIFR